MIVRRCAGGVVFHANQVLLVKNDRGEWTLPKGKISGMYMAQESAIARVKDETGIDAKLLEILYMSSSQEVDSREFVMP